MQTDITIDVTPLPADRMLAFHSLVGTAEHEGRTFEITRSEAGTPTLAFMEHTVHGIVTHTVSLLPVIKAALAALTKEEA